MPADPVALPPRGTQPTLVRRPVRFTHPKHDFAACIFDCDGTLADSMPLHHWAWATAFRNQGARFEFTWELLQEYAGRGIEYTVELLNARFGERLDPARVAREQQAWVDAHFDAVAPIAEVVAFAREIAKTRPVAVASGGRREVVHRTLKAIGMEGFFPVVVTVDDVEHGKPAPDMFLLAARKLGVEPSKCVVIEDGILGVQGAKAAGMSWVLLES